MPKLTKRLIDELAPGERPMLVWDSELRGFGVRVQPSGLKTFVLQFRTAAARSRRMVIGRHGAATVEEARAKARRLLVSVADGVDPMADRTARRDAPTMNDLLDRHISEHAAIHTGAQTLQGIKYAFNKFARPRLGALKVEAVTRQDIAKLHLDMRETPSQANKLLAFLSKAFSNAELWGLRPENSNPCRRIKRYPESHRERFLDSDELKRLGAALRKAVDGGLPWVIDPNKPTNKHLAKPERRRTPVAAAALTVIRLLMFTGARRGEIVSLEWSHVDLAAGAIALPEKKGGGRKPHPVSSAALEILAGISRAEGSPWVFPRLLDPKRHISVEVIENAWQRIRAHAGIPDVHLHDLRHTVGTYAGQAGVNAFVVRDLLRHSTVAMTGRYANFDQNPVRAVSDLVGERIAAGLEAGDTATRAAKKGSKI